MNGRKSVLRKNKTPSLWPFVRKDRRAHKSTTTSSSMLLPEYSPKAQEAEIAVPISRPPRGRSVNISVEQAAPPELNKSMDTATTTLQDSDSSDEYSSSDSESSENDSENSESSESSDNDSLQDDDPRRQVDVILTQIRKSVVSPETEKTLHGAYVDAAEALDQVWNAFTLQEQEIDAVSIHVSNSWPSKIKIEQVQKVDRVSSTVMSRSVVSVARSRTIKRKQFEGAKKQYQGF